MPSNRPVLINYRLRATTCSKAGVSVQLPVDRGILISGSYNLSVEDQHRDGRVDSFQYDFESDQLIKSSLGVYVDGGVLDVKTGGAFCKISVITGNGRLVSFDERHQQITQIQVDQNNSQLLHHCWSGNSVYAASTSGSLFVIEASQYSFRVINQIEKAHNYDVWTVISPKQTSSVITGGDDRMIKVWDCRHSLNPVTSVSKAHESGCCSLLSVGEHFFCSSGFDGMIKLWDLRMLTNRNVSCLRTGIEGIWNISINEQDYGAILASHIHHGFALYTTSFLKGSGEYTCDDQTEQPKCQVPFQALSDHANPLCYSSCFLRDDDGKRTFVSCATFYDKKIHVWSFDRMDDTQN